MTDENAFDDDPGYVFVVLTRNVRPTTVAEMAAMATVFGDVYTNDENVESARYSNKTARRCWRWMCDVWDRLSSVFITETQLAWCTAGDETLPPAAATAEKAVRSLVAFAAGSVRRANDDVKTRETTLGA